MESVEERRVLVDERYPLGDVKIKPRESHGVLERRLENLWGRSIGHACIRAVVGSHLWLGRLIGHLSFGKGKRDNEDCC